MEVVSLFSGCGGTDLGFVLADHKILFANDIDKVACRTYSKNFKNVEVVCEDIKKIKEFPSGDILLGCYPCQGFSLAGNRKINDERNNLYLEFARALRQIQPKFFVIENVKGIISLGGSKIFKNMLKLFRKEGYVVSYKLMNAKSYGVPQDRERVFIIGVRKDIDFKFEFPEEKFKNNYVNFKKALSNLPNQTKKDVCNYNFSYIYMSRNRKRKWNEVSFTIQAGGQHVPLHPGSCKMVRVKRDVCKFNGKKYRRLSYRECARVQTFPDSFKFEGNLLEKYKQAGNAVPPLLSFLIAKQIPLYLKKNKIRRSSKNYNFEKIIKI